MSKLTPEIQALSTAEKLALMREIWESVADDEDAVGMPEWQIEIVAERWRQFESGESKALPWEQVKSELHALVDAH
jgi:putative addiction module component (TIGR02574 family)